MKVRTLLRLTPQPTELMEPDHYRAADSETWRRSPLGPGERDVGDRLVPPPPPWGVGDSEDAW